MRAVHLILDITLARLMQLKQYFRIDLEKATDELCSTAVEARTDSRRGWNKKIPFEASTDDAHSVRPLCTGLLCQRFSLECGAHWVLFMYCLFDALELLSDLIPLCAVLQLLTGLSTRCGFSLKLMWRT